MNYIQVENISKSFGFETLFSGVSFGIFKGDKIALIAKNGTGKSTILNIIAGITSPDLGKVSIRNDIKINYLTQDNFFDEDLSIIDNILAHDNDYTKAIKFYNNALEIYNKDNNAENTALLNNAVVKMDATNAWEYKTQLTAQLGEFGLFDIEQKVKDLSGGQKKKISIALAIAGNPDLILLDEPTNHLDFEMIEWLEDYLSRSNLSILVVTHDRYFLDNVCNAIIEIDNNKLYTYKGNYSYFLEKKAEREKLTDTFFEKTIQLYKTELEWIRRMPKARGTKSKARIDSFEEISETLNSRKNKSEIIIDSNKQYLGKKILEINNISKSFDNNKVIDNFSYIFKRYEKVGVIGLNGCGKSTLLNIISGELKSDKGTVSVGQTVVMSYYKQTENESYKTLKVEDIVKSVAETISLKEKTFTASQFLYRFNFDYKMQQAFYDNLSGGEKRRLHLLLELIKNPNFLILDEPTNDLDIYTLQILEDYLLKFEGCLLIVSHDRFLLDKLCDHIFVFEKDGIIKDHYGNYTDYYFNKTKEQKKEQSLKSTEQKILDKEKTTNIENKQKKPSYKQLKQLETLENLLKELEENKKEITEKLNSGIDNHQEIHNLSIEYSENEKKIEETYEEWMEISEIINKFTE